MSEELKPCPFCGGEAFLYEQNFADKYVIVCEDCCVKRTSEIKEYVIKKWNTRQSDAELERLKYGVLPNAVPVKPCDMCDNYYKKFSDICERCCHNYHSQYELKKPEKNKDDSKIPG